MFCNRNVVACKEKCHDELLDVIISFEQLAMKAWTGTVKEVGMPDFMVRTAKD